MPSDTTRAATARTRGLIDIVVPAAERERAFRRARRHTMLVKAMKVVLPVTALIFLGYYAAALLVTSRLKGGDIAATAIKIDPTNLTMDDPRYSGFGKDGSEYKVHAKSAVTDLRMSAPICLDLIDGEITQTSGVVTHLKAKWGTYDQKKDLLELYDLIDVDATNGMTARLTRATVHAKESRIVSDQPVHAETDTGKIRANAMTLNTKARTAQFRDDVRVELKPSKPPASGQDVAPRQREAQPFGIDANSGSPSS